MTEKTKTQLEKQMRQILDRNTKGFFKDEHWTPIHKIQEEFSRDSVDLTLMKSEYFHNKDSEGTSPDGKLWLFEIPYQDKGGWYLRIVASFGSSTPENPMGRYDLVYTLSWSAKIKASVVKTIKSLERKLS